MQQSRMALDSSPNTALYQRYAPGIFAYLYRQIGSREDAEDILLDVFLAALENARFSTLDDKRQQAWIWTVARNKAKDHYRRFARHPSVPLKQVEETMYESEDRAPEHVFLKREEYAHLHTTMQALSPLQQEVLQLRFGHTLSCGEIATVIGKSEDAVRMLLSRTLKLLRVTYTK